jgi:hypothetical protein
MIKNKNEYCLSLRELKEKLNVEMTEDILYGHFTVSELLVIELKKHNRMLVHNNGYVNFLNKITSYKTKNVDVSIILYM